MRRLTIWTAAALALAVALLGFAAPAPAATGASVLLRDQEAGRDDLHPAGSCTPGGTNLTCVQSDTAIEPSIASNPSNPLNAVALYQIGRVDGGGDADNGYATTFDGGATWTYGHLPGLTKASGGPFDRASDAVVAFGPNNTVYANSLVFNDATTATVAGVDTGQVLRSGLAMNVSHDGGRTWGAPIVFQDDNGGGFIDKNWIVVDNSSASGHHLGRVYAVWDRMAPVLAAYSDDEGQTWQTGGLGFLVFPGDGIGALPLVLANGDLAILFATDVAPAPVVHPVPGDELAEPISGVSKYVVAVAHGAGTIPTGAPLVFAPATTAGVDQANAARQQRACPGLPSAAVDPSNGTIYAAWDDGRFRSDTVNDVVVTASTDSGVTWGPLVRVNSDAKNDYLDHFCASVGVGSDGSVRMAYRTRREAAVEAPTGLSFSTQVDTIYQESRDGGATWSAPLKVNTNASDMLFGARSRGGTFLGDYQQIAPAGANTYVVRTEPIRTTMSEPHTFPPAYHHQRTWVAVVGPAPTLPSARRTDVQVLGRRTSRTSLPSTGVGSPLLLSLALIALALIIRRALATR